MPITEKTYKTIGGQFAAHCAICRESLISTNIKSVASLQGEVAHIVGETDGVSRKRYSTGHPLGDWSTY